MADRKPYYTINKASDGRFYFNLVAANHETVATSQMYDAKSDARDGIDAVRRAASTDVVKDNTDD